MISIQKQLKHLISSLAFSFILLITICAIALPNAYAQSQQDTSNQAVAAFRNAYDNRYTWDENFPGYSAEVSVNYLGKLDQGIVRVKPDLSVEVINIEQEDVRNLIGNQLKMEIIHQRRVPFEKIHANSSFELGNTNNSDELEIKEIGDGMNSHYKVKDRIITQVNREMGPVAVTVDTVGTAKTPEGYLVTHFHTTFRDPKTGEILEKDDVRDFHEKIGKYYLLTNREIRTTQQGNPENKLTADILIRFNDVQPL